MEKLLERIWDFISLFGSGIGVGINRLITGLFGSANARFIKRLQPKVDAINSLEPKYQQYSDEQLRGETAKFKQRLSNGESLDDILIEAFAVCREAGKRFLGMRHYDTQLIGGMVLHSGAVAEMVTGEGKTLVATLPAYLNALTGKGVHVVTVNDYLARRDMEWMAPLYMGLGLTVGAIQSDMQGSEGNRRRQDAYSRDITYGTNNEFGFDYLRDNMRPASNGDDRFPKSMQQSQRNLHFAIIDEVDNILIDEARTPLIISGPAHADIARYADADRIARQLIKETHYVVNEKDHNVTLTDEGVRQAEKLAGVESFYTLGNMDWPHMIDNALKAHHLYKVDVNYVIKEGKIVIVDEFTGRLMEGRQWSDGLHQAVEAKEGVKIKEETQTLATITLQNYFKLYEKICGMTGTAMTEANEFAKIYNLEVVAIPTHRSMQRIQHPDVIYATEKFKWKAVADEVEAYHKWDLVRLKTGEIYTGTIRHEDEQTVQLALSEDGALESFDKKKLVLVQRRGRPILVGTVSIEKSELLSSMLERRGIQHQVLNAKNHKREAEIIAQAGRLGAVTIATNMAGRGTDIILGGNPETMAWAMLQDKYETRLDVPHEEWTGLVHQFELEHQMKAQGEQVKRLGGLHVIGTERHESRRIDLQLRGRCGRQGDPGSSRFYLSFDDDLIRVFAGPVMRRVMEMGGFKDDVPIESSAVSRRIDGAQKKREEFNFEIRKNLLEYDEVMDEQRKRIYGFRQKILDGASCREIILDMVRDQVETNFKSFLSPDFGCESFAAFAGNKLGCELEPRSFKRLNFDEADKIAHEEAVRAAETEVFGKVEENLPPGEDESEWNWNALANFANLRWQLGVRDSELKKVGRDRVDEYLLERARTSIRKVDLSDAEVMLRPDFGLRTALAWSRSKFALDLNPADFSSEMPAEQIQRTVIDAALQQYDRKEAEFPVMAGFYRFDLSTPSSPRLDREGLANWASQRFDADFSLEHFNQLQRDEIRNLLVETSLRKQAAAQDTLKSLEERINSLSRSGDVPLKGANGAAQDLANWFRDQLQTELPFDRVENLETDELREQLEALVEDHYHPEIRRMERMVLLDVVDSAWKDHLLAMDYLRSAVGHRGMAALDPKVEYKREGMRMFESLWQSINERVTELVFRMELINEGAVRETFVETKAVHAPAPVAQPVGQFAESQQQAIEQSGGGPTVTETIRYRGEKVGRNDPCPCGSGKKYKSCCLRKGE
jgi:preprotein translocase subunit SecA